MNNQFDELTRNMAHMKSFNRPNRSFMATAACAALTLLHTSVLNADGPPVRIAPLVANAAVTATLTQVSGPLFSASATGVVQTSLLGTCVENAQLEVLFPATPDQPVLINGTATFVALDGTNSLNLCVSGKATPDPFNPFFYNAKYQVTFTGGTGAYVSAKGLAEITEVVMFTSQVTGTASWNMKGFVTTPR